MAVGTQQLEVLEPIVEPIPVDVMKLHVQWLPPPFADPAPLAAIFLEALTDEPKLQVRSARSPPGDEQVSLEGKLVRTRRDLTSPDRPIPSIPTESKPTQALPHGEPLLVDGTLDGYPVVAARESRISGLPERSDVVGNGGLRHAEFSGNAGSRVAHQ
jgi:hypothetical protein